MNPPNQYKTAKAVELQDGSSIVMLDMLSAPAAVPSVDVECNVYRLDATGQVVWRVSGGDPVYPRSPFTGIGLDKDRKLLGYRWEGTEYEIDLTTGRATLRRLTK